MRRAHAIAMLERISREARGDPNPGFNRRAVMLEACHACDAGSISIVTYELSHRDIESIVRMLKGKK